MFERRWGLVPFVLTGVLAVGCGAHSPGAAPGAHAGSATAPAPAAAASSLVSGPADAVERRGGIAVVPACAIVPVEDVRAAGLPLLASPLTAAVRRVRLDPAVVAGASLPPLPAEVNSCWYALASDERRGSVRATVLQPALFGHDTALGGPAVTVPDAGPGAGPAAGPTAVDVRVVHAGTTDDPRSVHVLRHRGTVVELVVDHLDAASSRAIVESAVARLAASSARPVGQPSLRHVTGRFPGSHADACALTSGSAVPDALGGWWPLQSERLATAVGTLDTGGERHAYVDHRCVRSAIDGRDVNVHTATFAHADGARAAFDRLAGRPGVQAVDGVGDAAVRGDLTDLDDALAFRVGRVVVHVSDGGTDAAASLARTISLRLAGRA